MDAFLRRVLEQREREQHEARMANPVTEIPRRRTRLKAVKVPKQKQPKQPTCECKKLFDGSKRASGVCPKCEAKK